MRTAILAVLAVGCAGSSVTNPQFANSPAVTHVDDRRDAPIKPDHRDVPLTLYYFDSWFYTPMVSALELREPKRAFGVNAIDEVPDSTWFTNRVGTREITPDQVRTAPGGVGFFALSVGDPRIGHEYRFDSGAMFNTFMTAGVQERTWEERDVVGLRGVGSFEVATFKPGNWKPATNAYSPFLAADRFDKFWGAKIVMRFTREQIRAAVDTAQLTDPRAADYIVDTLVGRQRATGRYWSSRVNPLDQFAVTGGRSMCFDDLAITYGYELAATTTYKLSRYDRLGRAVGSAPVVRANTSGRTCVAVADPNGYAIVRVETSRPGFSGSTEVHLARDPSSGAPRIIGLWRR